jgi:hypothetical protein
MKPFGWLLLASGLTGIALSGSAAGSGSADNEPNRNDPQYLRKQYAFFQSLRSTRQQELRKLDADFHNLDKDTQERLLKVLDNYNWWISQLPEEDRKRVTSAETSTERLKVIQEIKNREWIATLPAAYREEFDKAIQDNDRLRAIELMEKWRGEQRRRRDDWLRETWLEGHSLEEAKPKMPDVLQGAEIRLALDAFANNLETQVPVSQRERLRFYREQSPEERDWLRYLRLLVDLADRYPLLPGPQDGPRSYDALPKGVKESLERGDRVFAKKKNNLPQELQKSVGRWPDFAVAVAEYAKQHRITLTEPIVPATRADMPAEVRAFLDRLEAQLGKQEQAGRVERVEQAHKDLARLKAAEGKWPDYPRTILDLAKQHRMPIPDWTLPVRNEMWDAFRMKMPRKN